MRRKGMTQRSGESADMGALVGAMRLQAPNLPRPRPGVESLAAKPGPEVRIGQDNAAAIYPDDLPWADFAGAWSEAEARLACLEHDLAGHELRPFWICRTDFQASAAVASLRGDPVAMDDLVLGDAGLVPRGRSTSWVTARALLTLRRHIGRVGPARVLTVDGILELEAILGAGSQETAMGGKPFASASRPSAVERWLSVVEGLTSIPPLPAAAMALRWWRRIAPLATGADEIGLLLSSVLLWHWGKTKSLSVCPTVGTESAAAMRAFSTLDGQEPLGSWIAQYCRLIQVSAGLGLTNLKQMELAVSRQAKLQQGHRSDSRSSLLIRLFLTYPVITTRFISQRLEVSVQGASWLLKELIEEGVVLEATDRAKNRGYQLV